MSIGVGVHGRPPLGRRRRGEGALAPGTNLPNAITSDHTHICLSKRQGGSALSTPAVHEQEVDERNG